MRKDWLILIILLLFSIPAVKSLFIPGGFTSHDLTHHVIRQISMDRLLSEGQFPPRWSGDLNNGYGYPVFLFNYPLPAMVGEIFHLAGLGYVDSVKAVLFSSMILSVLGMYLFLNALLKDEQSSRASHTRMAAFLGAIFYLYAPIRFLSVYVSAAVGSALGLGILPFVFWALVEIKNGKKWAVWVGGLSFAGLILAHNVTALIFAPVLLVFVWLLVREVREIRVVRGIGLMILLGLGLSAWFWMPAFFEAQYTRFGEIFGKFYADQSPTIWQLLRSPWGYGLSHPERPEPGDMSYQLGLIHILVMLLLIPLIWVRREIREIRIIGGSVLILFAISVFLMLKISLPLWENIPLLTMVQFPLRFSAIAIFSASIGVALLVKYSPNYLWIPFRRTSYQVRNDKKRWLVFILLLFFVIYANRNHWNINQTFDPGEDYYLQLKTTSTSFGEHLPKWGKIAPRLAQGKLEFVEGVGPASPKTASRGGEVRVIRDQSAHVLAEVEAETAGMLRFNQFYFPGWEIKVDNKVASFDYLSDTENYGLPVFDISAGKHLIEAKFKNTPIRNLADFISVSSLGLWLVLSFRGAKRRGNLS